MKIANTNKLVIFIFISCFLMLFGYSCTPSKTSTDEEDTIMATRDFSVDQYVQDKMVFQKDSINYINGKAEPNVKIIVEIVNSKKQVVVSASTITSESGDWQISFPFPEGHSGLFTLKVMDSHQKYVKEYQDIVFGDLVVLVGEQLFFNQKISDYSKEDAKTIRICSKEGKWYTNNDSDFQNYYTFFMNQYALKFDSVIGFIDLTFDSTSIGSFLKKEIIEKENDLNTYNKTVYELLIEKDERDTTYQNCELYYLFISKFQDIACKSLISYQGMTDFESGIDFSINSLNYAKSYSLFLKDLKNNFCYENLLVIETPSMINDDLKNHYRNIPLLREAQSTGAYYNKGIIVPTYNFGNQYHTETEISVFTKNLINVLYDKQINNKLTPSYANLIIRDDEILIEISNCTQLEELETINNFQIFNKDGNLITEDYDYYVVDNRIIIKVNDFSINDISVILYNFQTDISNGNLLNEESQIVNPFKIVIKGE